MIRVKFEVVLACLVLALAPLGAQSPKGLSPLKKVEKGVLLHRTRSQDKSTEIWAYLPDPAPKSLPCVFIAPAGSRLFHGMDLAEGDMPEHLPFVKAGFAVVAYTISGPMKEKPTAASVLGAAKAFKDAEAGVKNGKAAVDWALKHVPGIDKERLYSSGHSSAGTLSLQLAQGDARIKGCVAFAPVPDTAKYLGVVAVQLDKAVKGYRSFIETSSPAAKIEKLRCPTFLFCAKDDDGFSEVSEFAAKLRRTNKAVTMKTKATGGHYDPMIEMGIPEAIKWLKGLAKKGKAGGNTSR